VAPDQRGAVLTPEKAFGEVLQELRRERNLSQEKLAELSDSTQAYISYLENGKNSPSLSMLFGIAAALGVSPTEILARVETRLMKDQEEKSR
jgi:transcriptional regulator with XRE-family HTH domain